MKLGPIDVPEVTTEGVFPLRPDWGWSRVIEPQVAVHTFESGNRKVEQRFYLGDGARRYALRFDSLRPSQIDTLKAFWEDHSGAYGQFYFDAPTPSGAGTSRVVCRFAEPALSISHVADLIASVGVTLIEVPEAPLSYAVDSTIDRYPDGAFEQHLAAPIQTLIPLLDIVTHESHSEPSHALHLSDRYCTLGETRYHARLLDWDGISQSIGNDSDVARFVLANADRVLKLLSDQVALDNAQVQFSAYHVQTATRIDIWGGCLARWVAKGATFEITVQDGIFELLQKYPRRRAAHTCWKRFKSHACAYQGDEETCDKTFDTCKRLANQNRFGGIMLQPQPVTTRDNSQSGRPKMTTTTIIADTIYDLPIPEVYTDREMIVPAILAGFREEGDFASGLGVVSEGPIGGYASPLKQYLDGAPPHGPGNLGWRGVVGNDPQAAPFGLSQAGPGNVWIYPNSTTAAGTAFVEIRKKDASGLQLSRIGDHQITVAITAGVGGWVWDDPQDAGSRRWEAPLTNPVWVMVNVLLRARALHYAEIDPAEQVAQFDLAACHATAALCDLEVPCIIDRTPRIWVPTDTSGNGYWDNGSQQTAETQFVFCGRLGEEKPLRDWLTEIAQGALLYFTFRNNKLRIGIRSNATPVQAFGPGNIVADSLQVEPIDPDYNQLTVRFGNCDNNWELSNVDLYDEDQAWRLGAGNIEVKKSAQMNLVGCPTPSQAARVCIGRLRETLGGVSEAEQVKARRLQFASTVISLAVDPGMCCSLTHEELPDSYAVFRVQHWRLRKDWGIEYSGSTVAGSCYEYMTGPRPNAAAYTPAVGDPNAVPKDWGYGVHTPGDGTVRIGRFYCQRGAARIRQASFEVLYIDESTSGYARVMGGIEDSTSEGPFAYQGAVPRTGQLLYCAGEVLEVAAVEPDSAPEGSSLPDTGNFWAKRGRWGTTPKATPRISATVAEVKDSSVLQVGTAAWHLGDPIAAMLGGDEPDEIRYVASVGDDGNVTVERPFDAIAIGDIVYSDPRLYRCDVVSEVFSIDASFWTSGKAAGWERAINLPGCSLVAVRGQLASINYRTDYVYRVAGRIRTLGNQHFEFVHPAIQAGRLVDAFCNAPLPAAAAFQSVWAEALPWAGSGFIQLEGELDAEAAVTVIIEPVGEMPKLQHSALSTAPATLADAALLLADHLNAQTYFAKEYVATAQWTYCLIQSIRGACGALVVRCEGSISATVQDVAEMAITIPTPPSVASVVPGTHQPTGKLRVWAGTEFTEGLADDTIPDDVPGDAQMGVRVSGDGSFVETSAPFLWADHGPVATAGDLAAAVVEWLRADPVFGAHYQVSLGDDGLTVWLADPLGNPGSLEVGCVHNTNEDGAGIWIEAQADVSSPLGIPSPGRRYAITWSGRNQESAPSALSGPSGASGSAGHIELQGLPACPIDWVDTITIYATPSGATSGPLYRIASVPATQRTAIDATPESDIETKQQYQVAPDQAEGSLKVQVKVNGRPWLELRIGPGETRSNVIDGLAAGSVAAGAILNADVESTDSNLRNLRLVLA